MKEGPSVDNTPKCYGCKFLDVWWNMGPDLHAKCKKKNQYIPGDHKLGKVDEIKTPIWCPFMVRGSKLRGDRCMPCGTGMNN